MLVRGRGGVEEGLVGRKKRITGKQLPHIANHWNNVTIVCLDRSGQDMAAANPLRETSATGYAAEEHKVALTAILYAVVLL